MLMKLKNSETNQTITLVSNGLTYLRYKDLTGHCLGQALSEFFGAIASGQTVVQDIENLQNEYKNYENLTIIEQQSIDSKLAKIQPNIASMASVMDKLILIVASMISSGESPNIRHIDDIVQDIDLNWFEQTNPALSKIMECIQSLLPSKLTQKKTSKTRTKK